MKSPALQVDRRIEQYRAEVIPTKAERTQRDDGYELAHLLEFFDDPPAPLESIEPKHVHAKRRCCRIS